MERITGTAKSTRPALAISVVTVAIDPGPARSGIASGKMATSSFSKPPTRCLRPGVPGTAHGRARFSSRRYGMNPSSWFGWVAILASITGRPSTSGNRHGSEPWRRHLPGAEHLRP